MYDVFSYRADREDLSHLATDEYEAVHRASVASIIFGAILAVGGVYALAYVFAASAVAVLALAWLLIFGAVFNLINAFSAHGRHTVIFDLLTAVLYAVAGVMAFRNPIATASAVTLVLAAVFIVTGIMRLIASTTIRHQQRAWMFVNGIVTVLLGALVFYQWPLSTLWLPGTMIGVDMLFSGCAMAFGGIAVFRLTRRPPTSATAPSR